MSPWHDNLKRYAYVRWLSNSSHPRRLLRRVKNGCSMQCARWRERIINLRRETCDGWILQGKRFQARNHTALRFAHKLVFVRQCCASEEKKNTEQLLNIQVQCNMGRTGTTFSRSKVNATSWFICLQLTGAF